MRRLLIAGLAVMIVALGIAYWSRRRDRVPALRTAEVPVRAPIVSRVDPVSTFPESFALQVAVLWTKADERPLGLIHALKGMGIPFFVTKDLDRALAHRRVFLYPRVDEGTFTAAQGMRIVRFVGEGGTLFAQNVVSPALGPLFGFREVVPSRARHRVTFAIGADPVLHYLDRPEEREVSLGSQKYAELYWTNGYRNDGTASVLASFEDGTAALLARSAGKGRAYLSGLGLMDVFLRCQSNRDFEAERRYVNAFEPGADVWMLILRAWYESSGPDWVRLATAPGGRRSMLLLSHDVDWENSFAPALEYARMEKDGRALSTFFIQTKYLNDVNSVSFFHGANLDRLRELQSLGFSIGSHTVIHTRKFNKLDLGTGLETFATYRPRALGLEDAAGATVMGEVRVSKELLDGEVPRQETLFFRSGHLRVPQTLPEALERCGYRFDSSFTAGDVLSNFPYALPRDLGFEEDSEIYEFPVTVEDEEAPGFAHRVTQTLEVIRANADNGAVSVVLIHTNEAGAKVRAESDLLRQLPAEVGVGDMLGFARFWRARDRLRWSVTPAGGQAGMLLQVGSDEAVSGLTFEFARPVSAPPDGGATVLADHRRVVLPDLAPRETRTFRLRFLPRGEGR